MKSFAYPRLALVLRTAFAVTACGGVSNSDDSSGPPSSTGSTTGTATGGSSTGGGSTGSTGGTTGSTTSGGTSGGGTTTGSTTGSTTGKATGGSSTGSTGGSTTSTTSGGTSSGGTMGGTTGSTTGGGTSGGTSGGGVSGGSTGGMSGGSTGGSTTGSASVPPPAAWLAYVSDPYNANAAVGVFVVPSANLSATPVKVAEYPSYSAVLYSTFYDANGGLVYARKDGLIFQQAFPNPDGTFTVHWYALDLTTAGQPVPRQISSESRTGQDRAICSTFIGERDFHDAKTAFLLYRVRGADHQCGTGDDLSYVINYTDSATTDPTSIPLLNTNLTFVRSGNDAAVALGAMVASGGDLVYLTDLARFTGGTSVIKGTVQHAYGPSGTQNGSSMIKVDSFNGSLDVYRFDSTGKLSSSLYHLDDSNYALFDYDDANVYYIDISDSSSETLDRIPFDGSATSRLCTVNGDIYFLGITTGLVLLEESPATSSTPFIASVAKSAVNGIPRMVATHASNQFDSLATSTSDALYINRTTTGTASGTSSIEAIALKEDGTVVDDFANAQWAGTDYENHSPAVGNKVFLEDIAAGNVVKRYDITHRSLQTFFDAGNNPAINDRYVYAASPGSQLISIHEPDSSSGTDPRDVFGIDPSRNLLLRVTQTADSDDAAF